MAIENQRSDRTKLAALNDIYNAHLETAGLACMALAALEPEARIYPQDWETLKERFPLLNESTAEHSPESPTVGDKLEEVVLHNAELLEQISQRVEPSFQGTKSDITEELWRLMILENEDPLKHKSVVFALKQPSETQKQIKPSPQPREREIVPEYVLGDQILRGNSARILHNMEIYYPRVYRDDLMIGLWENAPPERRTKRLHSTLHLLRKRGVRIDEEQSTGSKTGQISRYPGHYMWKNIPEDVQNRLNAERSPERLKERFDEIDAKSLQWKPVAHGVFTIQRQRIATSLNIGEDGANQLLAQLSIAHPDLAEESTWTPDLSGVSTAHNIINQAIHQRQLENEET